MGNLSQQRIGQEQEFNMMLAVTNSSCGFGY